MPLPVINIYARNYKDFTSEFRELKLKMISGEVNLQNHIDGKNITIKDYIESLIEKSIK